MKKLLIATLLIVAIFVIGCQAPQELKTKIDNQAEQIKNLETKINEQAATIEQLKTDFEKHIAEFHKKPTTPTKSTQPSPPPRVGR